MARFDCVRTKNVSSLRSARRVFVLPAPCRRHAWAEPPFSLAPPARAGVRRSRRTGSSESSAFIKVFSNFAWRSLALMVLSQTAMRGRAEAARRAHNPEVTGSSPVPATECLSTTARLRKNRKPGGFWFGDPNVGLPAIIPKNRRLSLRSVGQNEFTDF